MPNKKQTSKRVAKIASLNKLKRYDFDDTPIIFGLCGLGLLSIIFIAAINKYLNFDK